ncbi:uncharacterized protein BDZ83DRAFT_754052 [Colletotrichum acutatum]|uniref:Uncharacterized protein n=1 Tax=Glomerella acutata TaxID=27357 RepID=A0AAD8XCL3_GLOAC|nr:uncharacterized protein BDZ83DRAFT_754052 [Colletotrichum acutatum]KAK1722774.1 hypothetical protein BDZ83DRAFT_754052 [Colletotrichum acutatum]
MMADSTSIKHTILRNGTPKEVAKYLKGIRANAADPTSVTHNLHEAVVRGSIPHSIFSIWIPISDDAKSIVAALNQSGSTSGRRAAMRAFLKAMRSEDTMIPVWNAAGGAQGVATIMSNLSVKEVKMLCNGLARTASLPHGRSQRRAKLTELIAILGAGTPVPKENPDARPLLAHYRRILPACTTDRVAEHEGTSPKWTTRQRSNLLRTHPTFYEAKFLDSILSKGESPTAEFDVDTCTQLINNNFAFAKEMLLKFLDAGAELPITPDVFINQIALPIVKRLRRRRTAAQQHLPFEILELLVRLINRHPDLQRMLDDSLVGVMFYVIKFWEHTRSTRPRVEQHLVELLKLTPETRWQSAKQIVPHLRAVNPAVSYRLFRLMLRHLPAFKFDVDEAIGNEDISLEKIKGPWPARFFVTTLGRDDRLASLRLVQRLMAAFPDGRFLEYSYPRGSSIFEHEQDYDSVQGDAFALEVFLLRSSPASSPLNTSYDSKVDADLERRRKEASSSRDWESRALWAQSVLDLSIAAGSLDLYAENLLWARRFNKDVFTVRDLYDERSMKTAEGLDLLSGIEIASFAGQPDFDAAKSVRSANKIMMQLLETASMATREPSFQAYDWQTVIKLPAAVIERRFQLVNEFQDARKLTDTEISEIVWQPTVDFLVELETFLLRPSHQELNSLGSRGLGFPRDCLGAREKRSHTFKFADGLAKARDELWQKHRPQRFPSVLTLGEPWPKGLPLQSLLPTGFFGLKNIDAMPYIRERIEKVVFGAPEVLLKEPLRDKESQQAIGRFVDEYSFALKAYIDGGEESCQQEERTRKAWRHAVDSLSGVRMTKAEALRFWEQQFNCADVPLPADIKAEFPRRVEISIPEVGNPETPTEWNPDSCHTKFEELGSKKIPVTILDVMMSCNAFGLGRDAVWAALSWSDTVQIPPKEIPNFWDASQFSQPLSGKVVDAYFASLLLSLNTIHGSDSSVLKHPFPSEADFRYPALYLDEDFLETIDEAFFHDNQAQIEHIIKSGPPALLVPAVNSILQNVAANEDSESLTHARFQVAMKLVKVLAGSDQPSLAFPFIRDIVLNRPSDSAWHRELLTKGFFNAIPPKQAKKLLCMISIGIQEKLEEQQFRYEKAKKEGGELAARSPPVVKVTTVKMLAKLLSNAPFLDVTSAVDILSGLLSKAQHIDIRLAIIQTMFDTLEAETASPDVKNRILSVIEDLAVPLAASLDELHPMTEDDWTQAEADDTLSEVANVKDRSAAPIRSLFYNLEMKLCNDPVAKAKLVGITDRLILRSAENNRRWLELFLKKNDFSLPSGESLPLSPVDPAMLKIFQRTTVYFSRPMLGMLSRYVLANVRPSPGMAAVTKKIESNATLANSNAGRHWLQLFSGNEGTMVVSDWTYCLEQMHLPHMSKEVANPKDRITVAMLQRFAEDFADGLISHGDPSHVEALLEHKSEAMMREKNPETLKSWQLTTQPVLRSVIARVEELRTPSWQHDPMREPKALPNPFRLRVAMLAVPPGGADMDALFAKEISALIDELANGHAMYHNNWIHLKHQLARNYSVWTPRLVYIATILGDLSNVNVESPTLADYLRVETARDLIKQADYPKVRNDINKLKEILRTWKESPVEKFRSDQRDIARLPLFNQ